jgi:hypothetical protein
MVRVLLGEERGMVMRVWSGAALFTRSFMRLGCCVSGEGASVVQRCKCHFYQFKYATKCVK